MAFQVRRQITLVANEEAFVDLKPYERFAGGGGAVAVRAACTPAAGANMTLMIGSETITSQATILNDGDIDNETPAVSGRGAPADPITLQLKDEGAGSVVDIIADIEFA